MTHLLESAQAWIAALTSLAGGVGLLIVAIWKLRTQSKSNTLTSITDWNQQVLDTNKDLRDRLERAEQREKDLVIEIARLKAGSDA